MRRVRGERAALGRAGSGRVWGEGENGLGPRREVGGAGPSAWEQASAGLECGLGLGSLLGFYFPFLFLFPLPFLFLIQTKFEFKYKFEFKPHSNN